MCLTARFRERDQDPSVRLLNGKFKIFSKRGVYRELERETERRKVIVAKEMEALKALK